MTLLHQLKKSLALLEHRRMMIPRFCDQSKNWNGHNHYSMDMIPPLDEQIEEMKAAIKGIEEWRKSRWKKRGRKPKSHPPAPACGGEAAGASE